MPGHPLETRAQRRTHRCRARSSMGQPHRRRGVREKRGRPSPSWLMAALPRQTDLRGGDLKFWGEAPRTQGPLSLGHRAGGCLSLSKNRTAPHRSIFVSCVSIWYSTSVENSLKRRITSQTCSVSVPDASTMLDSYLMFCGSLQTQGLAEFSPCAQSEKPWPGVTLWKHHPRS